MPASPPLRMLLVAATLAGCVDDRLPTAGIPAPAPEGVVLAALECAVDLQAMGMRCGEAAPPPGVRPVILGGQGINVRLENHDTWKLHNPWKDEIAFGTRVTIQNLIDQPLGTNGADTSEIRIFFVSGPTVTAGRGEVHVVPSGRAMFTAADQPYIAYPGYLRQQQVSSDVEWRFNAGLWVERFSFTVLVHARIPAEWMALHWRSLPRPCEACILRELVAADGVLFGTTSDERDIWEPRTVSLLRSGDGGLSWTESLAPLPPPLLDAGCRSDWETVETMGIWAPDSSQLYVAVYRDWLKFCDPRADDEEYRVLRSGMLRSRDGGRSWHWIWFRLWTVVQDVWGSSPDDVYAVGSRAFGSGVLLHSTDGFETHTETEFDHPINAVWGTGANDVWVAGGGGGYHAVPRVGFIAHSVDGGASWTRTEFPDAVFTALWGTATGELFLTGMDYTYYSPDGGRSLRSTPVSQFQSLTFLGRLHTVWGTGADDVYAAGGGKVMHFNGLGWWPLFSDSIRDTNNAVAGLGRSHVVLAGRGVRIGGAR